MTAKRRALDALRRLQMQCRHQPLLHTAVMSEQSSSASVDMLAEEVGSPGLVDERRRLFFVCCHPQLDRNTQVAISLTALGRLVTEEIVDTFLVPAAAITQRIVRETQSKAANNPFVRLPLDASARGPDNTCTRYHKHLCPDPPGVTTLFQVIALITPVFCSSGWLLGASLQLPGRRVLGSRAWLLGLVAGSDRRLVATNDLTNDAGTFAVIIAITIIGLSVVTFLVVASNWALGAGVGPSRHGASGRAAGDRGHDRFVWPETLPLLSIMVATWVRCLTDLVSTPMCGLTRRRTLGAQHPVGSVRINDLAVIVGMTLNLIGAGPFIDQFFLFELLGRATLPIGLLTVGAAEPRSPALTRTARRDCVVSEASGHAGTGRVALRLPQRNPIN